MRQEDIRELYFIAPIANLSSILNLGILCHRRASEIPHTSIALSGVQERRSHRIVFGLGLHGYANLYFNPRNAMMYKRREHHHSIVVIGVSPNILDAPRVAVSDGNAAAKPTKFFRVRSPMFNELDSRPIFTSSWYESTDSDFEKDESRRKVCAEVLVPNAIPPTYFRRIYCSNSDTASQIAIYSGKLDVVVDEQMFFQRRGILPHDQD